MKEFGSLAAFASHLVTLQASVALEAHRGLKEVAEAITITAKGEIGAYQQAIGPFPAWAQLAESTMADRVAKGYTPDDPLLRDGKMRDSVSNEVASLEAVVGSDSDIAVYQELGTDKIPPRPFLGPAVIHSHEVIKRVLGAALARGVLGGGSIPASLAYDHDV